jgi:hypothetical protein
MFDSKSIFASKTFWLNVLGGAATILSYSADILPPHYAALALAAANVLNRLFTKQPVHLIGG